MLLTTLLLNEGALGQNSFQPDIPSSSNQIEEQRWIAVTDTLSLDELLDVAIKFFPVLDIDENNHLIGQMCVSKTLHSQTDSTLDKRLESFCRGVIYSNLNGKEFDIYSEYVNTLTEVSKMNLGLAKEDRLLRAQGAVMMAMKLNNKLRQLFQQEYTKQKHMLHFLLKEE
ncbi:MAG: hypothetical protein KDB98_11930 [Flavobacteriales bacterium]|nr:hypothetical protein [Flavobacteriales bacterium]